MNPPSRQADWAAAWEDQSQHPDQAQLDKARTAWRQLSPAQQLEVAKGAADRHRAVLTRRYAALVTVIAGLRRQRNEAGEELLHLEPCLIFMVRQKLAGQDHSLLPDQILPPEWLSTASQGRGKSLVAVPTDVQQIDRFVGARSLLQTGVEAPSPGALSTGSVGWVVRAGNDKTFAVSAAHVFSPFPGRDASGLRHGTAVRGLDDDGQVTAAADMLRTARFGGLLSTTGVCFDVQWAEVLDRRQLRSCFSGLKLDPRWPWIRDAEEMRRRVIGQGARVDIHVPGNNPLRADVNQLALSAVVASDEHVFPMEYGFSTGPEVIHHAAYELHVLFGAATSPGDSGCPILMPNDNRPPTLVGFLIAGHPETHVSFMIPAWRILDPESYPPGSLGKPSPGCKFVSAI